MSTALRKYQRLEATALWRAGADEQRREVIVAIGDATLVVSDTQDRPLAHWSLAALMRANPDETPALYHPAGDSDETLEFGEDESEIVAAIEKLRLAIHKRRPNGGRLRWGLMGASAASVLAVCVFWLPGALVDHATSALPERQKQMIGNAILADLVQHHGPRCDLPRHQPLFKRLRERLQPFAPASLQIAVLQDLQVPALLLPGNTLVLSDRLLRDYDDPDVMAGYILAQLLTGHTQDPLHATLTDSGLIATLRLMTSGALDSAALQRRATTLGQMTTSAMPDSATLLQGFRSVGVKSTPYAYAVDPSGETTLTLIEADPYPQAAPRAVLSDADWLRLQAICEG